MLALSLYGQTAQRPTTIRRDVHHDISPPLVEMIRDAQPGVHEEREAEPRGVIPLPLGLRPLLEDPVRQQRLLGFSPQLGLNFEGLGDGEYNFWVEYVPPDTNGAVGATQYVQWVNTYFAVFDKATGDLVAGPASGNSVWTGFGGNCETTNDGDPIVLYDKLANRWVMGQFSITTGPPYYQCIAVSETADATGSWYRYAFQYSDLDDYPKVGVWPDAYYETFNMFDEDGDFVGSDVCAYNRSAMLSGQPATQICFQQGPSVGGLLPADVDGTTAPPSGSPNYMMNYGASALDLYQFHVDFDTPSNSTFTGPTEIPVAAFTPLCNGGSDCVPQMGTTQALDSLADRLMYRLAYRNFGSHEALVVNHSVAVNGGSGIRWYEIQSPGSNPVVAQQGTYAPDSSYRWMGSIAMDHIGDIAVGYSVSSGGMYPAIAFAGRLPSDPAGTLEAETSIMASAGSQINTDRWGDYSGMTVDPTDDCTFWYTNQYQVANGAWNWHTRIVNFKFPGCSSGGYYVGFAPTTLNFGNQVVGTHSSVLQITLSNLEPGTLFISSIVATGDFHQTNTCGSSLASNAQCTINVTFQPTATGVRTGTVTVTDSGPGSPRVANLNGLGTLVESCTPNTLSNASFESGTLQCWTAGGALVPQVSTTQAEDGSFSALLGATGLPEPDGDSWIYQTISVPASMQAPTLTFWYWPGSSDTIDHNWQEAQIRDTNGNKLAQVFQAASNTQVWTPVTFDLSPYKGQTVELYFNVHEDGYGNPTYMYLDNISIAEASLGLQFIPVTPCRVVDTRGASGTFGGPSLAGGTSRDFPIPQGSCGIPATAAAYALNVTAVPHTTMSYLTIWPAGSSQPVVSTLNSYDGRIKANAAIVPAGTNQAVSVFVTDTSDVILDINGYFVSGNNAALAFVPLIPCRVADTRGADGPLGGPQLQNGQARDFPLLQASSCNIPSAAQAYSLNFTAAPKNGHSLGYLSVWPAGQSQPTVSTLNAPTGTVTANAAIIPAGTGGDIMAYAYGNATDLIIDINGYFAPASSAPDPLSLYNVQPCRILDTRNPQQGSQFQGELTVNVVGGPCPLPASAQAYVMNATVVPPHALGYLTLWPDGQQQPTVSTLNAYDGSVTSNLAIVPTTNGEIDSFASNSTNLILDVFGYFAP